MLIGEIEGLSPEQLEARWEEVLAFVAGARQGREVAAGCLAVGRVHEAAGRFAEAYFALDEASRHYRACGLEAFAADAEARAKAIAAKAFPVFKDEGDLEACFGGLVEALLVRAEAWSSKASEPVGTSQGTRLLEREVFYWRLQATVVSQGRPHPIVDLARGFDLEPADSEVLLHLWGIESDAHRDRRIRSVGREDFLPSISVRLLCRFLSGTGRVTGEWLSRFFPDAPLIRWGLVEALGRDEDVSSLSLSCMVRLSLPVVAFLSGAGPGAILAAAGVVEVGSPGGGREPLPGSFGQVRAWIEEASYAESARLMLLGGGTVRPLEDVGLAGALAHRRVVRVDLTVGDALGSQLSRGLLAARLLDAIPVLVLSVGRRGPARGPEGESQFPDRADPATWVRSLSVALDARPGPVVLVAPRELEIDLCRAMNQATAVFYSRPSASECERRLSAAFAAQGAKGIDEAAVRLALASEAVEYDSLDDLAREVATLHRSGGLTDGTLLRGLVRLWASSAFMGIAERLVAHVNWDDLVLPDDVLVTLNEIITFARYREKVLRDWGFADRMPYGRALSALFHGPPGTGKTLAACVLANDLQVDIFRVDLSQVVSKWVGETEKNLARLFDAASRSRALVLFDEADSLFGKRTEVKTAVDRYSNLEVNYLLQRLEDFEGLAILTTNYPENIDQAFRRRIRFKVAFPFPDAALRAKLWRTLIPPRVPVAGRLDFEQLATTFDFAGAHIRNAILRAAFKAAAEDRGIRQEDLLEAARAEAREAGILVRG